MAATKTVEETAPVDLGTLLDAGDGAFVTLVAGDTQLAAHRAVLSARSPVFEAMFRQYIMEAGSSQVSIADVEGPVLRQMVSYCYSLQVPQLPAMAPQLLPAADKYGLSALKAACEGQLAAQLTVENAAAAAVLAVQHSCPSLEEAAVAFIRANSQVMATKGWADAIYTQPEDVAEVIRLVGDTELSAPAIERPRPSPGTHHQPSSDHSQTPDAAAATTAHCNSPPPDADAVSRIRPGTNHQPSSNHSQTPDAAAATTAHCNSPRPDADADSRFRPGTNHQPSSDHSQTPDVAAATTAHCNSPPPDADAVSRFRRLSEGERVFRLMLAAEAGAVGELRALLAAGTDVRSRFICETTALHYAANKGHVEAASCLLRAGAEVDARNDELWTPLHEAAIYGHADVVRLLLAASADPNAMTEGGSTPLMCAAHHGRADAVAALLDGGADKGLRSVHGSALDVARQQNWQQVIDVLL